MTAGSTVIGFASKHHIAAMKESGGAVMVSPEKVDESDVELFGCQSGGEKQVGFMRRADLDAIGRAGGCALVWSNKVAESDIVICA